MKLAERFAVIDQNTSFARANQQLPRAQRQNGGDGTVFRIFGAKLAELAADTIPMATCTMRSMRHSRACDPS